MKRIAAVLAVFAAGFVTRGGGRTAVEAGADAGASRSVAPSALDDLRREVAALRARLGELDRPDRTRGLESRLARLERSSEFVVATGKVENGKAVPLPNEGSWRDGTPILPGQWVIAVSTACQAHTWRGTPKALHCEVDQDSRVATVYSEKWTYPGEGRDAGGVANYTIICSRGLGRATKAEVF